MLPADADRAGRVTGDLGEFRRSAGQQAPHQFGSRTDAGTDHFSTRLPPAPQGLRVVAELDAQLFQQPESLVFDPD